MKDISIYFQAVENEDFLKEEESLGSYIEYHTAHAFPELKKGGIAIIYCPEYRNGSEINSQQRSDAFRLRFEKLNPHATWKFPIYDLGTILPGESIKDTYFALTQVCAELVKAQIIPLVIGGTQDLTFPIYQAYQQLEQTVNTASIDYRFDLGSPDEEIKSNSYLSQILMHRPCFLFNHSVIGVQAPYVKQVEYDLFEKLYFDVCRLGEYNANFKIAEPLLRNADYLSIDLQAIRSSDFTGKHYFLPNGFYADQICQLAKYAGISDKLTAFSLLNFFPEGISASAEELIAQILWYFIDGVSQRKKDFPIGTKKDYLKFNVHLDEYQHDIVFYKSNKSDRWWMEVPYPPKDGIKFERHHMVPCNFEDYEAAMRHEMPDLWWKTYQKLS
jgi:formiminoglutamase